ncbi:hypothetical protein R4227_12385 [Gordonia amicalis]|uniref:hypothetical protein n=1 Tax=Gordonia amicalis TaxID=89053 RepID=UPI002953EE8A|nr:hypothetical protein [Gordonia amicalis]MDV7100910.1 hypothetical protein [Gordonia amicalis]
MDSDEIRRQWSAAPLHKATGVPWGMPRVPDIPLPPFTSPDEHRRFSRMLALHLALIDDGSPSPSTMIVNALITERGNSGPDLHRLELDVTIRSFFPAPWTPTALARQLQTAGFGTAPRDHHGRWEWLNDPDFTAHRTDGGWLIDDHERGSHHYTRLAHPGDLVLLWMSHFTTRTPFPFGWAVDDGDLTALGRPAAAVRSALDRDRALPYLENWRARKAAGLPDERFGP